jgi:hypothetical protein
MLMPVFLAITPVRETKSSPSTYSRTIELSINPLQDQMLHGIGGSGTPVSNHMVTYIKQSIFVDQVFLQFILW